METKGSPPRPTPSASTWTPMKAIFSPLFPTDYTGSEAYESDQRLMRNSWQFAAMTDDLRQENDFVTLSVGGVPVTVRNAKGRIRAFRNVCAHRQSLIDLEPHGNGPLRCRFHGWVYNTDGVPVGIPENASSFGLERPERERMRLDEFAVEIVGRLVFLNIGTSPNPLDLGPYRQLVESASAAMTEPLGNRPFEWAYNWKLGVENVVELYHAAATHPDTFRVFNNPFDRFSQYGDHSWACGTLTEKGHEWWSKIIRRVKITPASGFSAIDHIHIFPNTEIFIYNGCYFSIQRYEPLAINRTRLNQRLFRVPVPNATGVMQATVTGMDEMLRAFNVTINEEDGSMLERVQIGLAGATNPSILGWTEQRVIHFHNSYLAARG